MAHLCGGFPPGHACPVIVESDDVELCHGCFYRAKTFAGAGLPARMVPVGIVLEDFNAPTLSCKCGGDPSEPDHRHSLLHAKWAWTQGEAEQQEVNVGFQFQHWTIR